jgi:hypothetical protein
MEFSKVSEQNAWDAVATATKQIRQGESEQALLSWFEQQGVDLSKAVFPLLGLFDEGVYSGTLITHERKVIEFFIDLACPEDGDFEDVTDQLGPKDPSHPGCDLKEPITMALVFFDEQQRHAA